MVEITPAFANACCPFIERRNSVGSNSDGTAKQPPSSKADAGQQRRRRARLGFGKKMLRWLRPTKLLLGLFSLVALLAVGEYSSCTKTNYMCM